jgi:tRNA modification GTPase
MLGRLSGWDDTIVALATPPGISAIGVIRLSGKDSIKIADYFFPSKNLSTEASHTLHVGYLKQEGKILDEVVISLYKAPKSYTGEDIVEVSCHGSPFVQQQVMQAFLDHGARFAKPGEFTQRAFLNGKLDLIQAEAVADLIASNTEASQKNAIHNIRGGFSHSLKELRDQLLSFSALIELELDFSQEDVEFADRTLFNKLITDAEKTTKDLLQSFKIGNVIKNGVQVAIIGRPNAGKSTLLNALLNENRAIVSEIAGTTRDTIEEVIIIGGIAFRLIDTAGIRDHSTDIIENIGMKRSLEKMQQADVVIYLFDAGGSREEIEEGKKILATTSKPFLLIANKIDLYDQEKIRKKLNGDPYVIYLSAKNIAHIESLKSALTDKVLEGKINIEGTIVTNARHYDALQQILLSVTDIRKGLDDKIPGDLIALDIRRCLHYLGEITGEITTEDQLDYIFSKFCIGK